jgi:hypothetical protein
MRRRRGWRSASLEERPVRAGLEERFAEAKAEKIEERFT